MQIINLTPHAINLPGRTIPPSGIVARVSVERRFAKTIDGITVCKTTYGKTENLPEYQPDTYYIVSLLVRQANPEAIDLLSSGEVQRDSEGNIIGCMNLDGNF